MTDDLTRLRNRIAAGPEKRNNSELPKTNIKLPGDSYEIFNGTHKCSSWAIGDKKAEKLLLVQEDMKDGAMKVSRWIIMTKPQVPGTLDGIEAGEALANELPNMDPQNRPELPHLVGEGIDGNSVIRVYLESYKDRLSLKITRSVVGGGSLPNWEWFKCGIVDALSLMRIILAAHDLIQSSTNTDQASPSGYDLPIPF